MDRSFVFGSGVASGDFLVVACFSGLETPVIIINECSLSPESSMQMRSEHSRHHDLSIGSRYITRLCICVPIA